MQEAQVSQLAKENLLKIKSCVFGLLKREGYLKNDRDFLRVPKSCQRRERSPRNLTEIFKLNSKGELKRSVGMSTTSNGDKKQHVKMSSIEFNSSIDKECSTPLPKKRVEMNISIEQYKPLIEDVPVIVTSPPKPLLVHIHRKSWQQYLTESPPKIQRMSVKKASKRKMFIRTLENETKRELEQQKQALSLLGQYQWKVNKAEKKVQEGNKKSQFAIAKKKKGYLIQTIRF